MKRARLLLLFGCALSAHAQKFYTYLTDLGPTYAELSWGTTTGRNTIGRTSASHGAATIEVANQTLRSQLNHIRIERLEPDRVYAYRIAIAATPIGSGEFRTWAEKADRLAFFVIGDYGTGKPPQRRIAEAMWAEFQRRANTDNPVRFMLSTGDNIYGNTVPQAVHPVGTGASDRDWKAKFFAPYEPLIARIPFFGTLGNHDGNESESRADLSAYLDNFPFPGGKPARYYTFTYGGLAQFFALDTTRNTESGPPHPNFLPGSEQSGWLRRELSHPNAPWLIPYFHHAIFNAGPFHGASLHSLQHWADLFAESGVKAAFNGHEHNFQMSEANARSQGIRFITSGAGGQLRGGDVQSRMKSANIAAWAPQNHFLLVEIEGRTLKVTPLGYEPITIKDSLGRDLQPPFVIAR